MKVEILSTKCKDGVCIQVKKNCKECKRRFKGQSGVYNTSSVIVETHCNQGVIMTVRRQLSNFENCLPLSSFRVNLNFQMVCP